jgi:oxalate decarboxylase
MLNEYRDQAPVFNDDVQGTGAITLAGGQIRVTDSRNFAISKRIAAVLVEIEPGAIRELHWHPNTDEWRYYLAGQGRMTVFASGGKARTFDYQPSLVIHYVRPPSSTICRGGRRFRSAV